MNCPSCGVEWLEKTPWCSCGYDARTGGVPGRWEDLTRAWVFELDQTQQYLLANKRYRDCAGLIRHQINLPASVISLWFAAIWLVGLGFVLLFSIRRLMHLPAEDSPPVLVLYLVMIAFGFVFAVRFIHTLTTYDVATWRHHRYIASRLRTILTFLGPFGIIAYARAKRREIELLQRIQAGLLLSDP